MNKIRSPVERRSAENIVLLLFGVLLTGLAAAADSLSTYDSANRYDFPRQVFWGDTHLHTSWSVDANSMGNSGLGPAEAYRFARGETVIVAEGLQARLQRPLDFLVVSDHAEYLGIMPLLDAKDPTLLSTEAGRHLYQLIQTGKRLQVFFETVVESSKTGQVFIENNQISRDRWREYTAMADNYNAPGIFTTFIGYEWTSSEDGNNLHRNVIFRDGAELARQILPFSALNSKKPEDLWAFLADYEQRIGGKALAIPHNPNISGGLMFGLTDSEDKPFTEEYATLRARWEPLLEVTQSKGDSETHPLLSPADKFADYERWDKKNFYGTPHENWMFPYEYARSALKLGLGEEARIGVNPFKFGMIGSSDIHTSISAVAESYFWGPLWSHLPGPERIKSSASKGAEEKFILNRIYNTASGRAAVWAEENTRESLFDAMQRRETYATTGSRIILRFFGGWDFDKLDANRPDYAAIGYRKGVPMGGDLTRAPKGKVPRFLIVAAKDPMGANLERLQVVKGWLDVHGEAHEKVWDAVLSDKRKPGNGMAPPIKSTVNLKTANYTNTVGEAELASVWEDPAFDPRQRAFYYVRALEIPTPRWTTYDAAFFGNDLPKDLPAIQQERAYSSPIWYTP